MDNFMEQKTKHHNIWILLKIRYPKFCPNKKPVSINEFHDVIDEWNENYSLLEEQEIGEFHAAKHHLELLEKEDDDKLNRLAYEALVGCEKDHPFNSPEYIADDQTYIDWLQFDHLSTKEAAALSIGRKPEKIDEILVSDEIGIEAVKSKLQHSLNVLSRHQPIIENHDRVTCDVFLSWLRKFDAEQAKIIEKYIPQETQAVSTEQKVRRLSDQNNERNKMLQLIIGMAMDKYRYDPAVTGGSAVTNIKNGLQTRGINISPDTIRKYLNDAKEFLPDQY